MRQLAFAVLAVFSPLAFAADRPGPGPQAIEPAPVLHVGIEHALPLAVPPGAKAGDGLKPKVAHVEEDETRLPLHLHIAADGSSRIECGEQHSAEAIAQRPEGAQR